MEQAILIVSCW